MPLLNKLERLSDEIKKNNKDIPKEADIYQIFTKALGSELEGKIETKTDKGITVFIQLDDAIRLAVGSSSLRKAGKGKVAIYEAVKTLLRWGTSNTKTTKITH